jgi:hypothetical protein
LLNNAFEEQLAFQRALKEYVGSLDPSYAKENEELFVAFEGSFGNKHVTPRTLMSKFLGNLVCVEGIVTKCKLFLLCDIGLKFFNGFNVSDTHLIGLVFTSFGDTYMRAYPNVPGLSQFQIYTYLCYLLSFFPSK